MKDITNILFSIGFFIASNGLLFAQAPSKMWDKSIGGSFQDVLFTVTKTSDGGSLLGGRSDSPASGDKSENSKGNYDYWVVKLDASGNKQWDKTLGSSGFDDLKSVIQTNDGGFLLGGSSYSSVSGDKSENSKGNYDYWVVKLDASGNKQWDKTLGSSGFDDLKSVIQTNDGGFLLGGSSYSSVSGDKSENSKGNYDYWVVKLDASGNKQWDKTLGGSDYDDLRSVIQTSDGSFLLGGYSDSSASGDKSENSKGGRDYWVVKLDASGNKQWDKTLGGNNNDTLTSVIQTVNEGFYLGGYSYSSASGDKSENSKGSADYWVIKLDASGNKQWDKTLGGNNNDILFTVTKTSDEGFLLGGHSLSLASGDKSENSKGGYDYWVVKLNACGNKQWDITLGSSSHDILWSVVQTNDGGFLLGGYSSSLASGDKSENSQGNDYWVVKLTADHIKDTELNYQDFVEVCSYDHKSLTLNDTTEVQRISWYIKEPKAANFTMSGSEKEINLNKSGFYFATFVTNNCTFNSDTVEVYYNHLDLTFEDPGIICEPSYHQLIAAPGGGIWSGTEISKDGMVDIHNLNDGLYAATYEIQQDGCLFENNVQFEVLVLPEPQITLSKDEVCPRQPSDLTILNNPYEAEINWFKVGEESSRANSDQFITDEPGEYFAEFALKACVSTSDSILLTTKKDSLFVPNVITSNNDGANDDFRIYKYGINDLNLTILNRWGKIIYKDDNQEIIWNPGDQPSGIYYWHIQYFNCLNEKNSLKGWLHVLND